MESPYPKRHCNADRNRRLYTDDIIQLHAEYLYLKQLVAK